MKNDVFSTNGTIWDQLYSTKSPTHQLPSEDLVIGINRYLPKDEYEGKRLLEVGCGPGNNISYLAARGFEAYGVYISPTAIEYAQQRLSHAKLQAQFHSLESNTYPFEDDFFDVVVIWHVLVYNNESSLQQILNEVRRVLKPTGSILANLPTFRDFSVSNGKQITKNSFALKSIAGNQEGAIVTGAETKEDVALIFSSFDELDIGYSEISIKGTTYSNWVVYGR